MYTPNRRSVLLMAAASAAVVAAAALAPSAFAAEPDLSTLTEAPAIGEKVLGKDDAPVTIIEYASATCPHCATFHKSVFPQLKSEFIETGKVRFVFREFPFDDLALAAFMLARCAPADKYFPMVDMLFEQQKTWAGPNARTELFRIAQMAGFTQEQFDKCLTDEAVAKGIIEVRNKAAQSYGVEATPTFFINGKLVRGEQSIEAFRQHIAEAGR
jgi:protein-disulfide isomerase